MNVERQSESMSRSADRRWHRESGNAHGYRAGGTDSGLGLAGWLVGALGAEAEAAAWMMFGVGLVWVALTIWWALRGSTPAHLADGARRRYLAPHRHAEFHPDDDTEKVRR